MTRTTMLSVPTPREVYDSPQKARAAARRMWNKGRNVLDIEGETYRWDMSEVRVSRVRGLYISGYAVDVEIPATPEGRRHAMRFGNLTIADAVRTYSECRARTAEILASHGFPPF